MARSIRGVHQNQETALHTRRNLNIVSGSWNILFFFLKYSFFFSSLFLMTRRKRQRRTACKNPPAAPRVSASSAFVAFFWASQTSCGRMRSSTFLLGLSGELWERCRGGTELDWEPPSTHNPKLTVKGFFLGGRKAWFHVYPFSHCLLISGQPNSQ